MTAEAGTPTLYLKGAILAYDAYLTARDTAVKMLPALLAEIRARHGLKQKEIAGRLGVTDSYLSALKYGQSMPGPELMRQLLCLAEGGRSNGAVGEGR